MKFLQALKGIIAILPHLPEFIILAEALFPAAKMGPTRKTFVSNMVQLAITEGDILGPIIDAKVEQMKAAGELPEAGQ